MPTRSRSANPSWFEQTTAMSPPKWDSRRWLPRIAPRTRGSTCSDSCRSTSTRLHPPATAALSASRRSSAVCACASRSPVTTHIPCPTREAWNRAFMLASLSRFSGRVKPFSHPLWGPREPGLRHDLLENLVADPLELDQHGRVAVEMRRREEDLGVVGDQGFLGNQVLHAGPEDRPGGRRGAQRLQVTAAEWPLPDEQLAADLPGAIAAHV